MTIPKDELERADKEELLEREADLKDHLDGLYAEVEHLDACILFNEYELAQVKARLLEVG